MYINFLIYSKYEVPDDDRMLFSEAFSSHITQFEKDGFLKELSKKYFDHSTSPCNQGITCNVQLRLYFKGKITTKLCLKWYLTTYFLVGEEFTPTLSNS